MFIKFTEKWITSKDYKNQKLRWEKPPSYCPISDLYGNISLALKSRGSSGSGTDMYVENTDVLCTLLRAGNAWWMLFTMDWKQYTILNGVR